MFPTEVCATIRFNFSVFKLWIEPSTPQNPDGPGMVNTGLEEFPSHTPELLNKWKTQLKLIKTGLIQTPWELHHPAGVEVHRSVADAAQILLVQNSKGMELPGRGKRGSRSPKPWPELREHHSLAGSGLDLLDHLLPAAGAAVCWFHLLISCLCLQMLGAGGIRIKHIWARDGSGSIAAGGAATAVTHRWAGDVQLLSYPQMWKSCFCHVIFPLGVIQLLNNP